MYHIPISQRNHFLYERWFHGIDPFSTKGAHIKANRRYIPLEEKWFCSLDILHWVINKTNGCQDRWFLVTISGQRQCSLVCLKKSCQHGQKYMWICNILTILSFRLKTISKVEVTNFECLQTVSEVNLFSYYQPICDEAVFEVTLVSLLLW